MDTNIDTEEWVVLPGFGLPVQEMPSFSFGGKRTRFPHAIADFFASKGVTLRELRMLEFINQITDKPGWEEKVFNSDILSKWRAEASRPADVPGEADVHLSEQMFDYVSISFYAPLAVGASVTLVSPVIQAWPAPWQCKE
jgi:hypothetical protein